MPCKPLSQHKYRPNHRINQRKWAFFPFYHAICAFYHCYHLQFVKRILNFAHRKTKSDKIPNNQQVLRLPQL